MPTIREFCRNSTCISSIVVDLTSVYSGSLSGGSLWYVCLIKSLEMLSVFIWLSATSVVMCGKYLSPKIFLT